MRDFDQERICDKAKSALPEILDKSGLSANGLDNLYKIVLIVESLKNMEYMDLKWEYYENMLSEMKGGGYSEAGYSNNGYSMEGGYSGEGGGYSNRGGNRGGGRGYSREGGNRGYSQGFSYANRGQHYVRGHYSRSDGRDPYMDYMDGKQSYRSSGKSEDCKKRMIQALEDHMEMLTQELGEMSKDSDCREERETIKRYVDKLRNMM